MDARAEHYIATYFDSYNQGDDEAHWAHWSEGAEYYGSGTQVVALDLLTARRILKASKEVFEIRRITPLAFYGEFPRIAARVEILGQRGPGHRAEGVFVFHFDDQARIIRLWALWNPTPFLAYQA